MELLEIEVEGVELESERWNKLEEEERVALLRVLGKKELVVSKALFQNPKSNPSSVESPPPPLVLQFDVAFVLGGLICNCNDKSGCAATIYMYVCMCINLYICVCVIL